MGRGAVQAGLAVLLLSLGAVSSLALGEMSEILVTEERIHQGHTNVVHVAVNTPRELGPVDVHLAIEGIDGTRTVETTERVDPGDPELVTVLWEPTMVGTYTLEATTSVGDHVLDKDEQTVEVSPAPRTAGDEGGILPETAPGTVQWAIAFGILFFVARAGLDRRP